MADTTSTVYVTSTRTIWAATLGPVSAVTTSWANLTTSTVPARSSAGVITVQIYEDIPATVIGPPTCDGFLAAGKPLQANPDVAGLGVLLAFLIPAYLTLLCPLFAYLLGYIPPRFLRDADSKIMLAKSIRVDDNWQRAFQKAALVISDQQLITGMAVLLAGFVNLSQDISAYHWQTIIYLAWMSSNIHLTSLTVLRDQLHADKVLRRWRVAGMLVLMVTLCAALIPTTSITWLYAIKGQILTSDQAIEHRHDQRFPNDQGLGIPARCFWPPGFSDDRYSIDSCLAFVILILSYIFKLSQLYDGSREFIRKWVRYYPQSLMERAAKKLLMRDTKQGATTTILYRLLMWPYTTHLIICEFSESFMASLWVLTIGLAWGTLRIVDLRTTVPILVTQQESSWGFGQILPLVLLMQPLAALLGHFNGHEPQAFPNQHLPSTNLSVYPHLDAGSDNSTTLGSDVSTTRPTSLSSLLRDMVPLTLSEKAIRASKEPQIEFLCSRKAFQRMLLMFNAFIAMAAIEMFWFSMRFRILDADSTWYFAIITTGAVFAGLFSYIPLIFWTACS